MGIRPLFSEYQWPRVESRIRESIEEFTLRRLQPLERSSAQYPDSPGNQASSFAQEIMVRRRNPPTPMPQNALHDPASVQGRVFTPSLPLADYSFANEMFHEQQPNRVQHSGRGNETVDSAYYTTFNSTDVSSHTETGFSGDEPVAIDGCVNPEATLLSPSQMFQLSVEIFGSQSEYLANPSGAQEQPDLPDLDISGMGPSQHRQNRY
jgi:hypothetical protein